MVYPVGNKIRTPYTAGNVSTEIYGNISEETK